MAPGDVIDAFQDDGVTINTSHFVQRYVPLMKRLFYSFGSGSDYTRLKISSVSKNKETLEGCMVEWRGKERKEDKTEEEKIVSFSLMCPPPKVCV